KIRTLIKLREKEKKMAETRLQKLEEVTHSLEQRKVNIHEKVDQKREAIHHLLRKVDRSMRKIPVKGDLLTWESLEAPRREVLSRLVEKSMKEVEALKIDL